MAEILNQITLAKKQEPQEDDDGERHHQSKSLVIIDELGGQSDSFADPTIR